MIQLHLLHELLCSRLLKDLEKPLVLWRAELRLIELYCRGLSVTGLECALAFSNQRICEIALLSHKSGNRRIVLRILCIRLISNRTGNDERSASFVDEHRVNFVDDRIDVTALHTLIVRHDHVVAQIVEAELVVRPVGDVALVCRSSLERAGLSVIDAPDSEAEILVYMA